MTCAAKTFFRVTVVVASLAGVFCSGASMAQAPHACDALGDRGWSTVATVETVAQSDSAPRQEPGTGEWIIERSITLLPFCNYYNAVGNYSLRSYSLSPETQKRRIAICSPDAQGHSVAVPPYAGRCPPG